MDTEKITKAKNVAYRLLKYRSRPENELVDRLKQHGFSGSVINKVVTGLKNAGFLDDADFTRRWIQYRLNKGYWFTRIKRELKLKGIPDTLIAKCFSEIKENNQAGAVIDNLIKRRIRRYKGRPVLEIRRKLFAYLYRRGFPALKIYQKLDQIDYENI